MSKVRSMLIVILLLLITTLGVENVSRFIGNVEAIWGLKTFEHAVKNEREPWDVKVTGECNHLEIETPISSVGGAPSSLLWRGIALMQARDLHKAALLLDRAVSLRPWDVFAGYFLARIQETCQNNMGAIDFYAMHPDVFDSSIRLNDAIECELHAPHDGTVSQRTKELLPLILQINSDNIWAKVLLSRWGLESDKFAKRALEELRFQQLLPQSVTERQRALEAIQIAVEEGYIHPDMLMQVIGHLIVNGEMDRAQVFTELSPEREMLKQATKMVAEYRVSTETDEHVGLCNGWLVTNRSERPDNSRRRYEDGEFNVSPIIHGVDGERACLLQGLWVETADDYLAPSILIEKPVSVTDAGIYLVGFNYKTMLESPEFRLSAHVSDVICHPASNQVDFVVPTQNLPASFGETASCFTYLDLDPEKNRMKVGLRLWSPGMAIINDVFVNPVMSSTSFDVGSFRCQ